MFIRIFGNMLVYMAAVEKDLDLVVIVMSVYSFIMDILVYCVIILGRHWEYYKNNETTEDDDDEKEYIQHIIPLIERTKIVIGIVDTIIIKVFINLTIADIIAWCATIMFTISAIPQIFLNYMSKSTKNFSIKTMILRDLSILTYLISISILILDLKHALSMLQWLCGMSLNLIIDSIIYVQYYIYKNNHAYKVLN